MATARPIQTTGNLIAGDCAKTADHRQFGRNPVLINGRPIVTAIDLSTGHTGGNSETAVGLYPVLAVPTSVGVRVNGKPIIRTGDLYASHPDPINPLIIHVKCPAAGLSSVLST